MHKLQSMGASRSLRAFVRAYAQRDINNIKHPIVEPIPARLEQTLEFQFADRFDTLAADGKRGVVAPVVIVGGYTKGGFSISLKGTVCSFGIFFQPAGLSRLFGISMKELSHQDFDARDVAGFTIAQLQSRLADCRSFPERVHVAEMYLVARAASVASKGPDPMEEMAVRIFRVGGAVRVSDMAIHSGLSVRQFERRFAKSTGIAPKAYARVARFQTALDAKLLVPHRSWLDIAHDLGYHDQMHMVRDFHELAGQAPEKTLTLIGDGRPPAMLGESEF